MKIIITILMSFSLLNFTNSNQLDIEINRLSFSDLCIQGNLSINGKMIGYSLELPKVGNNQSVSSIKAGSYKGKVREDGSLGWRIELDGVQDRENIQIHIGNIRDSSRGCILVGKTANSENCTVGNSRTVLDIIKEEYYKNGNSDKEIVITIID